MDMLTRATGEEGREARRPRAAREVTLNAVRARWCWERRFMWCWLVAGWLAGWLDCDALRDVY